MKYFKLTIAFSTLLIGLNAIAQISDSAFAMLSESPALSAGSSDALNDEAALAKTLKTTKHANFRTGATYQSLGQYLKDNIEFPEEARELGKTGVVKISFDILPNGSIHNIKVLETPLEIMSDILIKTMETMPQWSPAYQAGSAIKTRQQLNVNFRLF